MSCSRLRSVTRWMPNSRTGQKGRELKVSVVPLSAGLQCVSEADVRRVLSRPHCRDLASDLIHVGPAAVGLDDREGGVETAYPAESDGLLESNTLNEVEAAASAVLLKMLEGG